MNLTLGESLEALETRIATAVDESSRLKALNDLSSYLNERDLVRSLAVAEEALALARRVGDASGIAHALTNRAQCLLIKARLPQAEADYTEALELSWVLGDRSLEASCLHGLSNLRRKNTDYAAAVELLLRARELRHEIGDGAGEAITLNNLGALCAELGSYIESMDYLTEGLHVARQASHRAGELFCLSNIACLKRDAGDLEEAVLDFQECLALAETLGNRYVYPHLLSDLCVTYLRLGRIEEALRVNERALELARENQDRQVEMDLLLHLGQICAELGMPDAAQAALEHGVAMTERLGDRERSLTALCLLGAFLLRQGDRTGARRRFEEVRSLAEEVGSRRHQALVYGDLARIAEEEGSLVDALEMHRRFHALEVELQRSVTQNGLVTQLARLRRESETLRRRVSLLAHQNTALEEENVAKNTRLAALQREAEVLGRQAMEDPLTGLHNRRFLDDCLPREVCRAQRYKTPLAVAIADLDNFKQINDRFTHRIGDDVLRTVAELLRRNSRGSDIVVRYGGEKFVIALPETDLRETAVVCERIRAAVQNYDWASIHPLLQVTVSIGIAHIAVLEKEDAVCVAESLLAQADNRLYRAKQAGKNRVES